MVKKLFLSKFKNQGIFFCIIDNQSVMTHPTIGGDSTSLSNSVAHLVDDRSNESTKALPGTGAVSLCESLPPNRYEEIFGFDKINHFILF